MLKIVQKSYRNTFFFINGCTWPWWFNRRCGLWGKASGFYWHSRKGWVPREIAIWELQWTFDPQLSFMKPFLSLIKVRKHEGTDWTKFLALHPFTDCMYSFCVIYCGSWKLTFGKQKDPFLVFLWSEKLFEIIAERVSALNGGVLSFLTANLSPRSWNKAWKIIFSSRNYMVVEIYPYFFC